MRVCVHACVRVCVRMYVHACVRACVCLCVCVILELDSFRKKWPDYSKNSQICIMFLLFKRTGLTVLLRTIKTILILVLHVLPHPVKVVGRGFTMRNNSASSYYRTKTLMSVSQTYVE